MRKWTYLVAALLMGGVTTSLTSCIDNDEPAGITDLRGAKAELLRAKAQVEAAKVALEQANAAYREAEAAIKAEKAKQEAFKTALLEAQTAAQKADIEQQAAISAANAEAALKTAQEAALQANLQYQRTLLEVNLTLATLKDDMYSSELAKLLTSADFSYNIPQYAYQEKEQEITGWDGNKFKIKIYELVLDKEKPEKTVTVKGLTALSQELAVAQYSLAKLTQDLAGVQFSLKPEDLQKKYSALKSYWEGKKVGHQEALEQYKKIQGVDVSAWEAEYDALTEKINADKAAKDAINLKLQKDLQPLNSQKTELKNKYGEVSELKITVPAGLETEVIKELQKLARNLRISGEADLANLAKEISDAIENQATQGTDGEYTISGNAISLKLSPAAKNLLLTQEYTPGVIYDSESMGLYEYFNSLIVTEENKAEAERKQQVLAVNLKDVSEEYKTASEAWTNAKKAFLEVADIYKFNYGDAVETRKYENDAVSTIKAQWNEYAKLTEPTEEQTTKIQSLLADYLAKRYELDAFDIEYNYTVEGVAKKMSMKDALKDATLKAGALEEFRGTTNKFGKDLLVYRDGKGLYGALYEASKALFGEVPYEYSESAGTYSWKTCVRVTRQVLVTYEEWKEEYNRDVDGWYVKAYKDNVPAPTSASNPRYSLGDGVANDYFAATWLKEDIDNIIAEQPSYKTLADAVQKLYDDNKQVIEKYNADVYAIDNQIADLENAAGIETAKYDVTIQEYTNLQNIMAAFTVSEAGTNNDITKTTFEQALKTIKDNIIEIEGGVKETGEGESVKPEYVKGELAKDDEEIKICQNYLDALTAETYPTLQDATVAYYEAKIEAQKLLVEALQVQFNAADEKRQQLIDAIANGTTIAPATPAE